MRCWRRTQRRFVKYQNRAKFFTITDKFGTASKSTSSAASSSSDSAADSTTPLEKNSCETTNETTTLTTTIARNFIWQFFLPFHRFFNHAYGYFKRVCPCCVNVQNNNNNHHYHHNFSLLLGRKRNWISTTESKTNSKVIVFLFFK